MKKVRSSELWNVILTNALIEPAGWLGLSDDNLKGFWDIGR